VNWIERARTRSNGRLQWGLEDLLVVGLHLDLRKV
jgi:hypothetical protein